MNDTSRAVVVAVGLDGAAAAVDFGAAEAILAHAPLQLVHVLQVPAVDTYADRYGGVLEDANSTLDKALQRARDLVGDDLPVTTERGDDAALISTLVGHADAGRMIVLQHRRLGRARRLVTSSTVTGVAARAAVPVVSVPEGWTRHRRPPVVTVGVQDPHEAEPLLRTAFREAALRSCSVSVLHAWWLHNGYDSIVADQAFREQREAEERQWLQPALDAIRRELPDVQAGLEVRHAPPADALLDATETSEVLVLGRRHHLLPLGSHLGPTVRTVVDHGDCPVLLVPEQGQAGDDLAP